MRNVGVALVAVLAGCNASGLMTGGDAASSGDAATAGDAAGAVDLRSPSGDLAGFCGDPSSPRIEVNGMLAASPAVTARVDALNCCEAAELEVISMQIPQPIVVAWRHNVGGAPVVPATLDLANLPSSWSVTVYSNCSPTQPGCTPSDQYTTGLAGTLTVSGGGPGYQMSTCLTVVEPAGAPHPVLHSLRLWVPTVSTP